jgi:hypothetical protein
MERPLGMQRARQAGRAPGMGRVLGMWRVLGMGRASGVRRVALGVACAMAVAGSAHADAPRRDPSRIEVDRDATPAGRVGFTFDGGEPIDAWGVSLTAGWIERPISIAADAFGPGAPASSPVRRRETLTLGGALALGDSVTVDAAIRASHQVGDRLRAAGDPARLSRGVFHDVRLGLRLRVAGDRDRAAFLRGDLTLPTGDDASFAGDARWTLAWRLVGRLTVGDGIVLAANLGLRLHGAEVQIASDLVGDELFGAAGIAVPLSAAPVTLLAEVLGGLGDDVGGKTAPSPLEARLGAALQVTPSLALGAHVGAGLVDELGAPRFRALLEVAYTPPAAPRPPGPPEPEPTDDEN